MKSIQQVSEETLKYIKDRKEGRIKSLRLGYPKLDKCMLDGIEWGSTITIGGRPSVGKSAFSDCLIDGALTHNNDFEVLDFNWELASRVIMLRRLSASLRKSYKDIISADKALTDKDLEDIEKVLKSRSSLPITFAEEPLTVKEFGQTVRDFVSKSRYGKVLVRVDHTLLAKQTQSNQVQMLLDLMMEANDIKRQGNTIFMFLTQMNREFEDRQQDGTDQSFPRQSDVYGGDAAAMFSETIILLNKPSKYGIRQYGKRRSDTAAVVSNDDLFAHIVKNRNNEGDFILHYKENFKVMSIKEL